MGGKVSAVRLPVVLILQPQLNVIGVEARLILIVLPEFIFRCRFCILSGGFHPGDTHLIIDIQVGLDIPEDIADEIAAVKDIIISTTVIMRINNQVIDITTLRIGVLTNRLGEITPKVGSFGVFCLIKTTVLQHEIRFRCARFGVGGSSLI